MKKQLIVAGIVTAAGLTGLAGMAVANAATNSTSSDPMSSLVQAIATKFNLKSSDVQAVIDEQKTKMDADREADVKAQVTQLVKDGKLTQAQADKINAKRAELEKEREANRTSDQSLTDAQRKTKMDERKTALDTWLKENGIDTQYAYLFMGGRGHGGPGGPDGGQRGDQTKDSGSTSSSSSTN